VKATRSMQPIAYRTQEFVPPNNSSLEDSSGPA